MTAATNLLAKAQGTSTITGGTFSISYQKLTTTLTGAVALPSIPDGATFALLQAETQDVRLRDDGTNPTTTVGMLLKTGIIVQYRGDLSAVKVINATAGSILNISYYG